MNEQYNVQGDCWFGAFSFKVLCLWEIVTNVTRGNVLVASEPCKRRCKLFNDKECATRSSR